MLRGGYAEQTIVISTASDAEIGLKLSGSGEIGSWLEFQPNGSLKLSRSNPANIKVIARPPADIPNGVYSGLVTAHTTAPATTEGPISSSVSAGVALKTEIEITGQQVVNWSVLSASVSDIEVGLPAELLLEIANSGNVMANLEISADIEKVADPTSLLEKEFSASVEPTVTEQLRFSVPGTERLELGSYVAKITITDGDGEARTQELNFDVLERGTLSISGEFVQLSAKPWAKVGEVVRTTAEFKNTGKVLVTAKFDGEISLDDMLITALASNELEVAAGESREFVSYFTPDKVGRYVLKGYVVYHGKTTTTKETILNVLEDGGSGAVPLGLPQAIFVMFILFIAILFLKQRKGLLQSFKKGRG